MLGDKGSLSLQFFDMLDNPISLSDQHRLASVSMVNTKDGATVDVTAKSTLNTGSGNLKIAVDAERSLNHGTYFIDVLLDK